MRLAAVALTGSLALGMPLAPATAAAQQPTGRETADSVAFAPITYRVHRAESAQAPGMASADRLPEPDPMADRRPRRVVQGPRFTWVLEEGAGRNGDAEWILDENTLLMEGPGRLRVRGWPQAAGGVSDSVAALRLVRGERDRPVAGRLAEHYELAALVERRGWLGRAGRRHRVTADLWIVPELPFTWAVFGTDARSLPVLFPALRERLESQLAPRGMVARAVLRAEVGGPAAASTVDIQPPGVQVSAFEVAGLEAAEPRPAPARVIDRSVIDALERLVREYPDRTCEQAAADELPAIMRARVHHDLWPPLVGLLSTLCTDRS